MLLSCPTLVQLCTLYKHVLFVQEVMRLMADGTVRSPPPRKCYRLEEAAAAVEDALQEFAGSSSMVLLGA